MSLLSAGSISVDSTFNDKFAAAVVDTGGKFATDVVDTGGAPWLANISTNFRKRMRNYLMKKTRSKKSRDTVLSFLFIFLKIHLGFGSEIWLIPFGIM